MAVTNLLKFDKVYRVVNDGTFGPDLDERIWEWCIPGVYGQIYPVGTNGDLGVLTENTRISPKIEAAGGVPIQGRVAFRFPVDKLKVMAGIIRAYKSRKNTKPPVLTEAQRAAATERLKTLNTARKASRAGKVASEGGK